MIKLSNDAFVSKLRELFTNMYGRDLELALTDDGGGVCNDAFFRRAINYHACMLPWIEAASPLAGKTVIEIGCGSGAATLALSERCAHVDAFDIDPTSLTLARERAALFKRDNVSFHLLEPDWALPNRIGDFHKQIQDEYDVVLLPAVLEHLRMDERLGVLEVTWGALKRHGTMVVYDTPNRLYAYDMHSFRMPFFNWLPDDLALLYASRSPRTEFPNVLAQAASPLETLYQLGRGVSYHEFDLAIGLSEFETLADGYSHLLTHRQINDVFEGVLVHMFDQFAPHVPPAFSKQFLEIVLQKKWHKLRLVERNLVSDQMLEGRRPALLIEGEDAYLQYEVPAPRYQKIVIEVLKHPWSSEILICDKFNTPLCRRELYSEYPSTAILEIPLPPEAKEFRLRVSKHPKAQGNQAWILGAGLDL